MRTIKNIFLLLVLVAGLVSCDFLNVVPDEKATEKDAFEDTDAAKRFMYSCYSYIPAPRSGTGSLDLFTADEVVTAFEHETFAAFPKGNYSASNTVISYWNTLFSGLKQCYIMLNNIDLVPGLDATRKSDYIAQTKFLIAYYHFLLIRSYGPVILIKEEPSISTSPADYAARSPYDECVEYACTMFDEAAAGLPASRVNENFGLATSVAAKSLKARLLLYAASPLFNGNSEYYADFKNPDGTPLMPTTYDPNKWIKAKTAYEEAIRLAETSGYKLYDKTDYELDGFSNIEPTDPIQHKLRYTVIEPANSEIIWSDSREEGAYSIQNKSLPFCNGSAYNGVAPTLTMLKRFYTKNGLPIEEDPEFDTASMFNVTNVGDANAAIGDPEAKTLHFNLNREPRFYAWIAFQGGFFEIMSATDGNGAYDKDPSYQKYNVSESQSKLVCNFVLGGNTSRRAPGETAPRTNNYSPTGFLNKKGVVPGYNVRKSLYAPPFYPWPTIRVAELYLGYAETCVEANDLNSAKTYLNKVRERAGIPTVEKSWQGIASLDQKKLRQIVRQERMIEFYLENQTFWDLRRWKEAKQYLNVKAKGMAIDANSIEAYAKETEVIFERKFESPVQYLMPIPLADVNRNLNLKQNPGY